MTFGILSCAVATDCIDRDRPCGAQDEEQAGIRGCALISGTIFFDLIAAITLVAIGALVLRGRVKLPTEAGIGLVVGAGGIVLMDVLGTIFQRCVR